MEAKARVIDLEGNNSPRDQIADKARKDIVDAILAHPNGSLALRMGKSAIEATLSTLGTVIAQDLGPQGFSWYMQRGGMVTMLLKDAMAHVILTALNPGEAIRISQETAAALGETAEPPTNRGESHEHNCDECRLSGQCPIEGAVREQKARGDSHKTPDDAHRAIGFNLAQADIKKAD